MANFNTQLAKCDKITPSDIEDAIFIEIKKNESTLLKLNKNRITIDSEDIYGKALGYYSAATEALSGGRKKTGDPFTGDDTGDWLKGFVMNIDNNVVSFTSTDSKNNTILTSKDWLSHDVFGLSDEDLRAFIKTVLKPFTINYYRKQLGL